MKNRGGSEDIEQKLKHLSYYKHSHLLSLISKYFLLR